MNIQIISGTIRIPDLNQFLVKLSNFAIAYNITIQAKKQGLLEFFNITNDELEAVGEDKIPELILERVALDSNLSHLISGRYLKINVFPLDFSEYLQFNEIKIKTDRVFAAANKDKILNLLKHYLQEGGFPRVTLEKDVELKKEYLKSYYDSVVYKDIVLLYKIRNVLLKIDNATLREYLYYIEQAKMLFEVHYFSYSVKAQSRNNKKIYCIDNGLRNAVSFKFSEDEGRLAENLVFVELMRREREVYYWKGNGEVDFVVRNEDVSLSAINVAYTNDVQVREVSGLVEFKDEFSDWVGRLIILTKDVAKTEGGIQFVPLWKWILGIESREL